MKFKVLEGDNIKPSKIPERTPKVLVPNKVFVRRRLVRDGFIITLILSIVFLLLIIYGLNVGNFVISISRESNRSLTMSLDPTFDNSTTRLVAEALPNAEDTTLVDIVYREDGSHILSEYTSLDGTYIDPNGRFVVYNFHLRNVGRENIIYRATMNIDLDYKKVSSAVRVLLVRQTINPETGEATVDKITIYAREQEDENGQRLYAPEEYTDEYFETYLQMPIDELSIPAEYSTTQPFLYNNVVFSYDTDEPFNVGDIHKYTFIMWLEGEDKQCTNDLFGSSIKFSMNFRVIE